MSFTYKQVSESRWGIYNGSKLLATVSDRATCETILANFSSGRRDVPAHAPEKLYQAAQIDYKRASLEAAHQVASSSEGSFRAAESVETVNSAAIGIGSSASSMAAVEKAVQMSDAELAQVLNTQSLKVNELESAVLQAQKSKHS